MQGDPYLNGANRGCLTGIFTAFDSLAKRTWMDAIDSKAYERFAECAKSALD